MANIHRLIVLLFLSFFSFNSFAAFSVPSSTTYRLGFPTLDYVFATVNSLDDVQAAVESHRGASAYYSVTVPNLSNLQQSWFEFYYLLDGRITRREYYIMRVDVKSCPPNSSPSGSECTCNAGYEEKNGNSCVLPEPPDSCKEIESICSSFKNEKVPSFQVLYSGNRPLGACSNPPLDNCSKGCYLQFTGISVYYKDNDGRNIAGGPASFTGDSCLHSEESSDPDPEKICKPGEFPGVVNGKKVCIPAIEKETEHQPKTENKPDGSTSETKSTVSCTDGKCTVTETATTKDSTGAVTGVSGTSTVYSEADFCQKNPASGVCTGTGTGKGEGKGEGQEDGEGSEFGGSCDSGFTCTGDAIQCSIAKSQHQDSCKLFAPAPAGSVPDGTEEGSAQDLQNKAHVINVQTDLDYSGLGWNRSCPADEDFDIGIAGAKMTIPYSKLCVVLSPMSDITLAITALGLLVWLVAGKKEA